MFIAIESFQSDEAKWFGTSLFITLETGPCSYRRHLNPDVEYLTPPTTACSVVVLLAPQGAIPKVRLPMLNFVSRWTIASDHYVPASAQWAFPVSLHAGEFGQEPYALNSNISSLVAIGVCWAADGGRLSQRPIGEVTWMTRDGFELNKLVPIKLAADLLSLPYWKLLRSVRAGLIPSYRLLNSRKLVRPSEVIAAIERSRSGVADA
jgi:hypothetical protein